MLGENIQKLRKQVNMSQEQLAEKIDVTRQTISNWELGETSPNPEQLKKLSKELNISIDKLLDNVVDTKEETTRERNNNYKFKVKGFRIITIIWLIAALTAFIESNYLAGIINILTAFISLTASFLIENKYTKQ